MAARVLVAYATKYGSAREIAERIATVLRDAGLVVDVRDAATVEDLAPYDAVVLGSALYAAHWRGDANRFVAQHLAALQERPVWLFSSGPLDRSAESREIPISPHVAAVTDPIGARDHRTFGGRLLADTPGIDPQILATHPTGDFRDWEAISAWAAAIAREIARLASPEAS
ncbi:MAG: flavodoxin domain-containing protein [Chloroflexota bacterium]|jgi:menaquinone-dependent protoporphyrinogen oxidase|nr:flavodoxin domain-containing protein [Chloroflexota bacterium]MDH5243155.1 flavodoxin domain-containing protein [Chloroflexota bacterium]